MIIPAAQRLGSVEEYYFSRKLTEIRQMETNGTKVYNLGIGNPDLPPPPAVVPALQKAAEHPKAHGYQPYTGLPTLREAMAAWSQRSYGLELDAHSEVLPLMGSKEGIFHISMAFLNPGDLVLVPDPGYPTYTSVSKLVGAHIATYPMGAQDFDVEALPLEQAKLMWLNTPHMPTGQVLPQPTLERLIARCQQHKCLLVHDNPYSMIMNPSPKSVLTIPGAKAVALELNSLSKTFHMPGWRIGWLAGQKEYVQTVLRVKSNQDSGMFKALQEAAIVALDTPAKWHTEINKIYARRQGLARQLLEQVGCTLAPGQQGMFLWGRLPEGANAEAEADRLLYDHHVFIPPGTVFGQGGAGHLRISLCVPEEMLKQVVDTLTQTPA